MLSVGVMGGRSVIGRKYGIWPGAGENGRVLFLSGVCCTSFGNSVLFTYRPSLLSISIHVSTPPSHPQPRYQLRPFLNP